MMPTNEAPTLPSYSDLADRTWVQLRECTQQALVALSYLTQHDHDDMARTTLETMTRILSPDWDGEVVVQHDARCDADLCHPACPIRQRLAENGKPYPGRHGYR